jgi:hypothetical protein
MLLKEIQIVMAGLSSQKLSNARGAPRPDFTLL